MTGMDTQSRFTQKPMRSEPARGAITAEDMSNAIERVARGTETIGAHGLCHGYGFCLEDAHAALAVLAGSPSFSREAVAAFAFAVGVDLGASR